MERIDENKSSVQNVLLGLSVLILSASIFVYFSGSAFSHKKLSDRIMSLEASNSNLVLFANQAAPFLRGIDTVLVNMDNFNKMTVTKMTNIEDRVHELEANVPAEEDIETNNIIVIER